MKLSWKVLIIIVHVIKVLLVWCISYRAKKKNSKRKKIIFCKWVLNKFLNGFNFKCEIFFPVAVNAANIYGSSVFSFASFLSLSVCMCVCVPPHILHDQYRFCFVLINFFFFFLYVSFMFLVLHTSRWDYEVSAAATAMFVITLFLFFSFLFICWKTDYGWNVINVHQIQIDVN